MRHIIFGGDGFVGRHLAPKLLADGEEVVVARCLPVAPCGPRDVGRDVLLLPSGEDRDALAGGVDGEGRRRLVAGVGRSPREEGAGVAVGSRLRARGGQPPIAVLQQRPGGRRVGCGEERHDEHVRVPEDVAVVAAAREAAAAACTAARSGRSGD